MYHVTNPQPEVIMNDTEKPEFATLRDKIAWEKAERAKRYAEYAEIFQAAAVAGMAAHEAALPTAMTVNRHADQLDDESEVVETWRVAEGICGFAWVTVRPGNSSFARWLVKSGHGRSTYGGGIAIWVSTSTQSYERKVAYARAMADVLQASPALKGLRITTGSRVD